MVSVTLAVPKELKDEMDQYSDINWSAIAREAIKAKILFLKKFDEFTKNSTLTEDDALRLGRQLNKNLAKRYDAAVG